MKILGMDISTTNIGVVLIDTEKKDKPIFKCFSKPSKMKMKERMPELAKDIFEFLKKISYDKFVISSAKNKFTISEIMKMEGRIEGIAIALGGKLAEYYNDSQWYTLIKNKYKPELIIDLNELNKLCFKPTDYSRSIKKIITIMYFCEKFNLKDYKIDFSNAPSKIFLSYKDSIISDDVCDAFAVASLCEEINQRQDNKQEQKRLQEQKNKLRAQNKKLRQKIVLLEEKNKLLLKKKENSQGLFDETGFKTHINSVNLASKKINDNNIKIEKNRSEIALNENNIEKLEKMKELKGG